MSAERAERLEALASELQARHRIKATALAQDLAMPDAVTKVLGILNRDGIELDILINNAGFGLLGPYVDVPADGIHQMLELNIVSLAMLTRGVLPGMLARRRGRIMNVASTAARNTCSRAMPSTIPPGSELFSPEQQR